MTASLQTTAARQYESSMQVRRLMTVILGQLRCATTAVLSLLYGGARAVSADDRYSLGTQLVTTPRPRRP